MLVGCSALTSFNCFKCNKTENFRESFVNSPVWCGLSHHNSRPAVTVRGRVVCLTPQFTDIESVRNAEMWKTAVEGRIKCDFVKGDWARPGRAEQSGETNYLYRRPRRHLGSNYSKHGVNTDPAQSGSRANIGGRRGFASNQFPSYFQLDMCNGHRCWCEVPNSVLS